MTPAQLRKAIEAQFPPTATNWAQATGEVMDMSRAARFTLGLDESHAVDFREIKTPADWNTIGTNSIIGFYEQMSVQQRTEFIDAILHLIQPTDAEILDWLERNHTLHHQVEALYVVDGYQVTITHDGYEVFDKSWHGATLREAYSKAMAEWDMTHGNTDLLAEAAASVPAPPPAPRCQDLKHDWEPDGTTGGVKCTKCGESIPF